MGCQVLQQNHGMCVPQATHALACMWSAQSHMKVFLHMRHTSSTTVAHHKVPSTVQWHEECPVPGFPGRGQGQGADLVSGPVAVLDAPHQAEGLVALALHVHHRVHDVLQDARPCPPAHTELGCTEGDRTSILKPPSALWWRSLSMCSDTTACPQCAPALPGNPQQSQPSSRDPGD